MYGRRFQRRRSAYWGSRYRLSSYSGSNCDERCWNARSPRSSCRCSCGGENHGRGYSGYGKYTPRVSDFLKSTGKAAATSAVIYGVSAASPPLGAFLIPAYTAYGYSKLGYGLLKIYEEIRAQGRAGSDSVKGTSESIGEAATQGIADSLASSIVGKASQGGLFKEMATKTGAKEVVIAEMMRGSTSSALSTGGGELAKFAVMKAVGA
jgi:hypothetical protein